MAHPGLHHTLSSHRPLPCLGASASHSTNASHCDPFGHLVQLVSMSPHFSHQHLPSASTSTYYLAVSSHHAPLGPLVWLVITSTLLRPPTPNCQWRISTFARSSHKPRRCDDNQPRVRHWHCSCAVIEVERNPGNFCKLQLKLPVTKSYSEWLQNVTY